MLDKVLEVDALAEEGLDAVAEAQEGDAVGKGRDVVVWRGLLTDEVFPDRGYLVDEGRYRRDGFAIAVCGF